MLDVSATFGEPPTVDAASALFDTLFFDSERYDLSAVGRVKMNMRLDLGKPDTQRTLDRDDIIACIKALTELRDRIMGHPAYANLTEDEECDVGGDTAELSYLARVANAALDA